MGQPSSPAISRRHSAPLELRGVTAGVDADVRIISGGHPGEPGAARRGQETRGRTRVRSRAGDRDRDCHHPLRFLSPDPWICPLASLDRSGRGFLSFALALPLGATIWVICGVVLLALGIPVGLMSVAALSVACALGSLVFVDRPGARVSHASLIMAGNGDRRDRAVLCVVHGLDVRFAFHGPDE